MQKIKTLPNYIKALSVSVSFVLTITGAIWAMEDRYVSDDEAAKSLELFQQKLQYENSLLESKIMDLKNTMIRKELTYVTEQYYKIKKLVLDNPNDMELKLEFEELKTKKSKLERELGE